MPARRDRGRGCELMRYCPENRIKYHFAIEAIVIDAYRISEMK